MYVFFKTRFFKDGMLMTADLSTVEEVVVSEDLAETAGLTKDMFVPRKCIVLL